MRKILTLIIVICFSAFSIAHSLCDQSMEEGIKAYNIGQYKDALVYFKYVSQECPSALANQWITKCNTAIANASKKSSQETPSKQTTLTTQNSTTRKNAPTTTSTTTTPKQTSSTTSAFLTVSPQRLYFQNYGGSLRVNVTCNKDWGFTYLYKDAAHQYKSYDFEVKRDGNTLLVSCQTNQNVISRSAQFDIFVRENNKTRYTIYITQEAGTGYSIYATTNGTEFPCEGGSIKVSVQSNTGWYVDSKSNWLGYRNKTNNSIEVYCERNKTSSELNGTIVLRTNNGNKTQTIYFKQKKCQQQFTSNTNYSKSNPFYDYLDWNEEFAVTWAQVGVGLGYPFNVDFSAFDIRVYWFELSLLNFGFQSNYKHSNWYWQPNVKFYMPINEDMAFTLSCGPKCNFLKAEDYYIFDYKTGEYYLSDDYNSLTWLGMNKKWWFNAQFGLRWEWEDYFGSEFFIRYNGCIAIGATINVHTGF